MVGQVRVQSLWRIEEKLDLGSNWQQNAHIVASGSVVAVPLSHELGWVCASCADRLEAGRQAERGRMQRCNLRRRRKEVTVSCAAV